MEDMTNTAVETQVEEGKNVGAAVAVVAVMAAGAGAGKLIEKVAKKAWNSKPIAGLREKHANKKSAKTEETVEVVED